MCAGHRLSTAEIEHALVQHPSIVEAAVVGVPHDVKGTAIFCFVILKASVLCYGVCRVPYSLETAAVL